LSAMLRASFVLWFREREEGMARCLVIARRQVTARLRRGMRGAL
jgi:hypothetical protein